MVGSGIWFCRAGLSEAVISTVGATWLALAMPWNRHSFNTRMFSSFPRILTHLGRSGRERFIMGLVIDVTRITYSACPAFRFTAKEDVFQ